MLRQRLSSRAGSPRLGITAQRSAAIRRDIHLQKIESQAAASRPERLVGPLQIVKVNLGESSPDATGSSPAVVDFADSRGRYRVRWLAVKSVPTKEGAR